MFGYIDPKKVDISDVTSIDGDDVYSSVVTLNDASHNDSGQYICEVTEAQPVTFVVIVVDEVIDVTEIFFDETAVDKNNAVQQEDSVDESNTDDGDDDTDDGEDDTDGDGDGGDIDGTVDELKEESSSEGQVNFSDARPEENISAKNRDSSASRIQDFRFESLAALFVITKLIV